MIASRTSVHYQQAYEGLLVAEELDRGDRKRLVDQLIGEGHSYRQVAWHTRLTEYTVARIARCAGANE